MNYTIEAEVEEDGRWLAEVPQLPGVLVTVPPVMRRCLARKCWP